MRGGCFTKRARLTERYEKLHWGWCGYKGEEVEQLLLIKLFLYDEYESCKFNGDTVLPL